MIIYLNRYSYWSLAAIELSLLLSRLDCLAIFLFLVVVVPLESSRVGSQIGVTGNLKCLTESEKVRG